jgi:hypothetical protein
VTLLHAYARKYFPELAYTAVALNLFVSHNSDEEASVQSSLPVLDRSPPAGPGLASGPSANPSTHAHRWVNGCLGDQVPCSPAPLSKDFPKRDFALDPRCGVENLAEAMLPHVDRYTRRGAQSITAAYGHFVGGRTLRGPHVLSFSPGPCIPSGNVDFGGAEFAR